MFTTFTAAEHLGRLLRTVFLCDYIAIEDFRREIRTLLNPSKGHPRNAKILLRPGWIDTPLI